MTRAKPGDRVIVEDVTLCGACEACKSGRYDLCKNPYRLDGQGGMAEEMVVHENMLNPFSGIDWVPASMTEPLAVAIACVDRLKLPLLGSLLIYGMGAIGLLSAAYARRTGAARVDLVAREPKSLRNGRAAEAAKALGADEIFYTKDQSRVPPESSYDAAIVAASPELAADALKRVKYGGCVLACGITLSRRRERKYRRKRHGHEQEVAHYLAGGAGGQLPALHPADRTRRHRRKADHHPPAAAFAGGTNSKRSTAADAAAIKTVMLCG